jgi:aspartyl-tRNA(Asn)/glutamyl-tRNA(Gln) amidotransferase subunit B
MRTPEDAHEYLTALKTVLLYAEVSDGNMEEGSLRCDANVSVRPRGAEAFGTRAEIKNLNSFRNVARAIEHEVARQVAVIESGGRVVQETRLWNADKGETASMRSKEDAHDYRYFPEPDLPPLVVRSDWREQVQGSLPELPADKRRRFVKQHGLPDYDAGVLTLSRDVADYFEAVARTSGNTKAASNWVMNEVLRKLKETGEPLASCKVRPEGLADMIRLLDAGTISGKIAKDVFEKMWATGDGAGAIVEREGLTQVSDEGALRSAIAEVMAASPDQVAAYRKGKTSTLGWFVGQVMKKTGGKANPALVNQLLKQALEG